MNGWSAFVFDLDGTLLDTLADIAGAVNRALVQLGFPPHPVADYRTFVGDGISVLARRVLPENRRGEKDVNSCLTAITREYGVGLLEKTLPYPGVLPLLGELVKRKIALAIASNKPHDLTLRSVEAMFKGIPFGAVLGERKGVAPKPDPAVAFEAALLLGKAPAQCVYVGDSGIDMQTASAAGMYPVGVLWGFRGREELLSKGAKALIGHPLELLRLLDGNHSEP
jgi:phosphoglycolate phosphatase